MIFLEIENVDLYWEELSALNLKEKYNTIRLVPIKTEAWGKECFLIDPAGVLWHFGEFFTS